VEKGEERRVRGESRARGGMGGQGDERRSGKSFLAYTKRHSFLPEIKVVSIPSFSSSPLPLPSLRSVPLSAVFLLSNPSPLFDLSLLSDPRSLCPIHLLCQQ
jgi:hypothetical protein